MERTRPTGPISAEIGFDAVSSRYGELGTLRRLTLWIDSNDAPLLGCVEWYYDGEHVGSLVAGCGPFETTYETLARLLRERRLP
jgi:hypothetical protein